MQKRFSFGVVRREQTRLRGFGGMAGAVCLVPFAGQTISVLPGILNQGERAGDTFNLALETGLDGDRLARERAEADRARRAAESAQARLFTSPHSK